MCVGLASPARRHISAVMYLKPVVAAVIAVLLTFQVNPVWAKDIPTAPAGLAAEEVAKIRNIIIGQLDAFKADDAEKAFSYAAPNIRRIFRSPEIFLHMVRKSYQSVYRPQSYEFRPMQRIDGNIVQPLSVVGPSGITETALYIMEHQPDGSWKIGACIMAREPGEDT